MSEVVSETKHSKRTLGVLRHYFVSVFFAIIALVLGFSRAEAYPNTWKAIAHFNQTIGCGFFFDEDHGLIGSGVRYDGYTPGTPIAIYKTTDGGVTWTTSTVPVAVGAVTSICMQDTLNGLASVFQAIDYFPDQNFGGSSLWKTTDGGNSWFDPFHIDHVNSCVYVQNGLILITNWDGYESNNTSPSLRGGNFSFDDGVTWGVGFRRANGIAFSDSLNGVVTEMNPDPGGNNFWVTFDAGRFWQATSNQYESWSVHTIPGARIYLCANESQPVQGIQYKTINWSIDGGLTWQQRASFPVMHFTGTIDGIGKTLYFQTDSTNYGDANLFNSGMYRSDDTGATWRWVAGPDNSRDTRFVVTGCVGEVVYAFDGFGNVWKTTDGGDGTLTGSFNLNGSPTSNALFNLSEDSIQWSPNPCGDTISFLAYGANCLPISVDSVSILSGSEFLRLPNDGSLPQILTSSDSAQILLLYSPTTGGQQVSDVRVYGHSGALTETRDVIIVTYNSLPDNIFVSADTCRLSAGTCGGARDTVYLANLGCSGMILDSVTLPMGEVVISTPLPAPIPDNNSFPLGIEFLPDSAGEHSLVAHVYAHVGRRNYDTSIYIITQATPVMLAFNLDSNAVTLGTSYCNPTDASVTFSTTGCGITAIDSIVSSNHNFLIQQTTSTITYGSNDSLTVTFNPDSAGICTGTIHVFAHNGGKAFDTTISVTGTNYALPQALTLSRTSITLSTQGCQGMWDTLLLSDQGCDSLYLDSAIVGDSEITLSYEKQLLPMGSNDSLTMQVAFTPNDGSSKAIPLRLFMHTATRQIDTTITLHVSNAIPAQPLQLSTDSIYLFTKYCQPVSLPLNITNLGCPGMAIDSVIVIGDQQNEFAMHLNDSDIQSQQMDTCHAIFTPDSAGQRNVNVRIVFSAGGKSFDTILTVVGKNLTAPVPYIPPLPEQTAGNLLSIPIMLEPTADTFSIRTYHFHLSFNTDMLTPQALIFAGTCSQNVVSSSFTNEQGSGMSGTVSISNVITNNSQLDLPLVYVVAKVYLTKDTVTPVILDTFLTDVTEGLSTVALCNIPEQPFQIQLQCGDPLISELLLTGTVSFSFVSVSPNPAGQERVWDVDYIVNAPLPGIALDVYDAVGASISHIDNLPMSVGEHHISVAVPQTGGDYFLVLGSSQEKSARKASVVR